MAAMLVCQTSTIESEEGGTINCEHCQAQGTGDNRVYWGIQLDQDLLETIISIYPEWFKDYNLNLTTMADWNSNNTNGGVKGEGGSDMIPLFQSREAITPPKTMVDEGSLRKSMDKNKESLKKKLLQRRPISQLVERGILPPLNAPPSFHLQQQKLERAKMGDILKNKIQHRPSHQELIHQHILEDTTFDDSFHEKHKQLKKSQLADNLNDRISHRPGPLELIEGNILQADEKLIQAVKDGQIPFKKTCEEEGSEHSFSLLTTDEDSSSDGDLSPPQQANDQWQNSFPSLDTSSPSSTLESPSSNKTTSISSPGSQIASPLSLPAISGTSPSANLSTATSSMAVLSNQSISQSQNKDNFSNCNKNRKKSKAKSQPKTRTIKFHEYKGPPSGQKSHGTLLPPVETSYGLLLQQQQLFLQWQLEWQQKYPQVLMSPSQTGDQSSSEGSSLSQTHCKQSQAENNNNIPQQGLSKLEDMKVSDLKAELKRRNLPVSGAKPQLIERLKPYSDFNVSFSTTSSPSNISIPSSSGQSGPVSVDGAFVSPALHQTAKSETLPMSSPVPMDTTITVAAFGTCEPTVGIYQLSNGIQPSVDPMEVDTNVTTDPMVGENTAKEDIVQFQQKRIEELQWELQRSRLQLQQNLLQKPHSQQTFVIPEPSSQSISYSVTSMTATMAAPVSKPNQQHKVQHQGTSNLSNPVSSAAVKANLAAFLHSQHAASQICTSTPNIVQQPVDQDKTFPKVTSFTLCPSTSTASVSKPVKPQASSEPELVRQSKTSLSTLCTMFNGKLSPAKTDSRVLIAQPPPDYDEATKQLQESKQVRFEPYEINNNQSYPAMSNHVNNCHSDQKSVKSQAVDDVLEILIKNGELPPSAAQEPSVTENQILTTISATISSPSSQRTSPSVVSPLAIPNISPGSEPPASVSLPMSPPSTVLNDADPSTATSLDFDLHLELEDFENMEVGVLGSSEERKVESNDTCIQQVTSQTAAERKSIANPSLTNSVHLHDPGMDIELTEWLDSMMPVTCTVAPSTCGINNTQPIGSVTNDHDPLLSNMSVQHDPFDLFCVDEIDFKTPTLMWDFAT
ncbi:uncharacterized protein LOC143257914 isoform X2 [Tachypleus tridentatus]|uniref:uncharacterized protein LOC143257914 isoform X2 n=1 Tax=Tachypleus tridentatus TaxID=6853 RepID=UPI003FD56529